MSDTNISVGQQNSTFIIGPEDVVSEIIHEVFIRKVQNTVVILQGEMANQKITANLATRNQYDSEQDYEQC